MKKVISMALACIFASYLAFAISDSNLSLTSSIKSSVSSVDAKSVSSKVWNFNISESTKAGLLYDSNKYSNWSNYDTYFRNYYSGDWGQLFYNDSLSQKIIVPETEGIYFYNGGYGWFIYTDGSDRIRSNGSGSNYAFMIPSLVEGQVITINYKSASTGSSRGVYCSSNNVQVIAGEEVSTEFGEVTYLVTSDGNVTFYPYNGGIYINSISVILPGDPQRLVEIRAEVAEYIATLDGFPGLKSELQTAYDNAVVSEDEDDIEVIISTLRTSLDNVKKAVEVYPIILADIEAARIALAEEADADLSEALTIGNAINVTSSTSVDYTTAFEALETPLAIYNSNKVEMSDWVFDTNNVYTIDGLRYYIDTAHNIAEFIGFNATDVYSGSLNIPATIRYEGTTYAVVALINKNQYSQNNITSVTLPKSLRSIGNNAFYGYTSLTYLEIPNNVTEIGSNIVCGAMNLHAIKVNSVVPSNISSLWSGSYSYYYIGESYYGGKFKITVPEESFHAYRTASVWKDNILIGGDGVTVSTGKIVAGDLGHVILDEATYLQEVNKLIIDEGTLNNEDWNTIKSMTNLIEIDMSGVTLSSLPASIFDGKWAIEDIKLPHNVTSIGNYALRGTGIKQITIPETITTFGEYSFGDCDSLRSVTIPKKVSKIPYGCFRDCNNLQKVELPNGIITVDSYAFHNCNKLSDINFPPKLTSINNYAFDGCSSLRSVEFKEGLEILGSHSFGRCSKLTEVILPSSLEKCQGAPFYGCTGIKRIEARSVIPPSTGGSCPLSNVTLNDVVLYVPSWSPGEYTLADGWSSFYTIESTDFMPQNIKVNKDFYFTVRDEVSSDYRPNISMSYSDVQSTDAYGHTNYERGNLTISGRSKLAVNDFSLIVSPFAKYYSDESLAYGYEYDQYRTNLNSTSLIVNGEMRAENVCMDLNNYNSRWQFVTFPFDVKVSDIVPQNSYRNASWVIRGHNSAMRAAGNPELVWENLTADDILEAGKGYIMHNYNPDWNNTWFWVYPLKNSVNRQLIFSSEDRTIELEEHLAEFDHNRSWNLIGNPYPCFYDSRFMDFDAPFMVWNSYNQNYVAYNPADDAYILSPGEAFFVQRPFEQESITFRKEGRQTHRYARELEVETPARAKASSTNSRTIYNLTLKQDSLLDRTRVVFNNAASLDYEMSRDAAKFASTEKNVPQIFTITDKTRFAINERPLATGDVALGIYCGVAGDFTISLDKTYGYKVILEDKLTKKFVELTADNCYTFNAMAGEDLTRFVMHFENVATDIDKINIDSVNADDTIYNLQGIKVKNSNNKGVYIKNGQKTVIK